MDGYPRECPICGTGLSPTLEPPARPNYWVRAGDTSGPRSWDFSSRRPSVTERPTGFGYRCVRCGKTFRIVGPA